MKTRIVALMAAFGLIASFSTACIGNFALTAKVRKFNLDTTPTRWGRQLLFLCLYIIPVYPFSGLIDILIINSIEFWSGTNPIDESSAVTPGAAKDDFGSRTQTLEDGTQITMTHEFDDTITAVIVSPEGRNTTLTLVRDGDRVTFQDEQGNVVIDTATQYVSPQLSALL